MTIGIDEDWAKANPQLAKQWGATFIVGYVSQDTTGKNLTEDDVISIHAAGLAVGLVYEFNPQSALKGSAQGRADALIAIAHAISLNAPRGVALYCAVDFNATLMQMPAVFAYCEAFRLTCLAAGFRSGVYGSYLVCSYLLSQRYAGFLWQTYAWSGGQWVAGTALRQISNGITVAGKRVDEDTSQLDDWGQWESEFHIDPVTILATEAMEDNMYGYVPEGVAFRPDGSWVDMTKADAIPVPLVSSAAGGWGPRWVWLATNQPATVRIVANGDGWAGQNVDLEPADGGRLVGLPENTTEIYIGYVSGSGVNYLVKGTQ